MSKISQNQSSGIVCGLNCLNFANRESLYGEVPNNHADDLPSIKSG